MQKYPDLLGNPDADPRVFQQQYEEWHHELDTLEEIGVMRQLLRAGYESLEEE